MPVAAVRCAGKPTMSAGSEMTMTGIILGWKMIFLVWVVSSVDDAGAPDLRAGCRQWSGRR